MDAGSWNRDSTSSLRFQSRSDLYLGGVDEMDIDDGSRVEYICPFCAEDFDIVGLCCHIDEEHPVEAKNGVCPVCTKRVGMDMVGHITTQHGSFFKVQRKRRFRKGGSNSTFSSILRKELREGNLQSLFGGKVSSLNTEADPLLSSFISNLTLSDEPFSVVPSHPLVEPSSVKESSDDNFSQERNVQQPSLLSGKDQEEKSRKCEFVQGLLLSTILDGDGDDDDDDFL